MDERIGQMQQVSKQRELAEAARHEQRRTQLNRRDALCRARIVCAQMEAEAARLERWLVDQQQRMAHMQAPLIHLITKANRDSVALFAVQLQMQRQKASVSQGAAVASAHVDDDHAAACGPASIAAASSTVAQPASASSALPSSPTLLHVLVSNPSRESVECSPRCLSLIVDLRLAAATSDGCADDGSVTVLSFAAPFPEVRWTPRQSFQASFPIDAQLLTHAAMQIRVKLRVRREEPADPGFTDVILRDWTIDAFDLCTPVLSSAALAAAAASPAAAATNHKRKRDDESNGGEQKDDEQRLGDARSTAAHAAGSVNMLHQQSLLSGDSRRVLHPPSASLFGSVYSTPGWYRSRLHSGLLAVPRPLPVVTRSDAHANASSSFQIAFAGPLQLGLSYQIKPANIGLVVPWLIRMLVSHLLPAHSIDCNESVLSSLLSGLTSSPPLKPGSSSFVQFDLRWPGSSRTMEWRIDFRVPSVSAPGAGHSASTAASTPQAILFVLRIRAPSPSLLPRVRSSVMQRLYKLLFQQSISANAAASSSGSASAAGAAAAAASSSSSSSPASPLPAGWSSVQFRRCASIAAMVGSGASKETHEAAADAQRWVIAYLNAARAAASAQTNAASLPPAMLQPVQTLASHLAGVRAQLASISDQKQRAAAPLDTLAALYELFLSARTQTQTQTQEAKLDVNAGANIFGSMQCIVV